ncbi:MAG: c-type cytochrome [Gemmatimonadales bacterium]
MRRSITVAAFVLVLGGCTRDAWQRMPGPDDAIALVPWFAVMHRGIAIQPYKMMRPPVEGTVPITGVEPSLPVIPANYAAIDRLRNPTERTAESLENGRKYFERFCVPCHGPAGVGDGLVNKKFFIAPSLLTDRAKDLSDGMIYAIIRQGRGAMNAYGRGVRGTDRWDVVNYVRQLQGASQ